MDNNYSIDEILIAVDELNNQKKNKKSEESNKPKLNIKRNRDDVPPSTLKLIEESERSLKN